ncbi:phytoene/squalene synthase family protein [Desertibaculum subflavum]|uniref:phytoene/squalene synthase family protein n=1 Tax=Desertibaculum subflavum TaxID=2268458 RepID=UPI0013C44905
MSEQHASDDQYCETAARRDDPDRWLVSLFAPDALRPRLAALLAFSGELARTREQVSQPMLGEIRLQWWREALDGIYAGTPRAHPIVRALAAAIAAGRLPREPFDRLIDARTDDLYETPPADIAALEAYAGATSAGLNRLLLAALGVDEARLVAAGEAIGMAWSLTGLARAAAAHAALRRIHLPADWMAEAGTDRDRALLAPQAAETRAVLRRLAERAAAHLDAARTLVPRLPREARAVLLLGRLVRLYLARLHQVDFDLADPRLEIATPRKQIALMIAAWRGRL